MQLIAILKKQNRLNYLSQQIPFTFSAKKQLLIAIILGLFLSFILIFLEPFNTNNFESEYKRLLLSGYGFILFITYFFHSRIETAYFVSKKKKWVVYNEVISLFIFFIFTGVEVYLYNEIFINGNSFSFIYLIEYQKQVVFVFMPILGFFLIIFRNKLGEIISSTTLQTITLKGLNKNEVLTLQKTDLLYIKSSENYIEIFYLGKDDVLHKTFRSTLSQAHQQVPFMVQSHRSYLVNPTQIKKLTGNSQKAELLLRHTQVSIPVSKTCYKKLKTTLSSRH